MQEIVCPSCHPPEVIFQAQKTELQCPVLNWRVVCSSAKLFLREFSTILRITLPKTNTSQIRSWQNWQAAAMLDWSRGPWANPHPQIYSTFQNGGVHRKHLLFFQGWAKYSSFRVLIMFHILWSSIKIFHVCMNNYNTENRLRYFSVFVPCTNDPLPYPTPAFYFTLDLTLLPRLLLKCIPWSFRKRE